MNGLDGATVLAPGQTLTGRQQQLHPPSLPPVQAKSCTSCECTLMGMPMEPQPALSILVFTVPGAGEH